MPLIILGLLLIIGIIAFWAVGNRSSDEPVTPRDLHDRYASHFENKARDLAKDLTSDVTKKVRKRAGIFDVDYDLEDDGYGNSDSDKNDNTIPFPEDVEREKKKRDIH